MRHRPLFRALLAVLATLALTSLTAPAAVAATAEDPPETAQQVTIRGGDTVYSSTGMCTVGFNVRQNTTFFALLPGHCGQVGSTWYADPGRTVVVGVMDVSVFPGGDYALIRYTNPNVAHPGEVKSFSGGVVPITGAAQPRVGQSICMAGRTTGLHCGTVTAVNMTVSFPEGTVTGLFRTTVCSEPGDFGGPGFSGSTALGISIGGSGNCTSGGTTYFQPVVPVLSQHGLTMA